ncbi:hypothetical protein CLV84_1947 [Neolewinella xylanilytica]|uniref:Tetratricopeptide repeat protein n=1 Tax=Neolewinella xylanilytica TaxID=1514080 RepID=A0A2S6I1K0_9BACT|nr:hypothetical protein [Neolewinella xylanilytica]PPK85057.1 hypothetical protein CLV84_1947 [Neolewinella xylanilytica]
MQPPFLLSLLLLIGVPLTAQNLLSIEETLKFESAISREGAMIYLKLPLEGDGQVVRQLDFSTEPDVSPTGAGVREYAWNAGELGAGDSLGISFRVSSAGIPPWTEARIDSLEGQSFAWPPLSEEAVTEPYVLPPLIREDIGKTEFKSLDAADTTLQDIDRLIRRLDRRIRSVRDPENFDQAQPLLEDVFRRRTTARRKPLLLSLALQYLDVPHRIVAGKVVSYGEVRENEVWVEIPVAGEWLRIYYGDGVDRSEWGLPIEPDQFLACSYDWRDLTLEIVSAPGALPVPSTLSTTAQNLVVSFWDRKNDALLNRQYARAAALMDSVLAYLPESVAATTEKGLVIAQAGRLNEALPFMQSGLEMAKTAGDQSFALVQVAKFYSLQRMGEEAIEALVRAQQLSPFDFSVVYNDPRFQYLARQPSLMQRLQRALRNGQ